MTKGNKTSFVNVFVDYGNKNLPLLAEETFDLGREVNPGCIVHEQ